MKKKEDKSNTKRKEKSLNNDLDKRQTDDRNKETSK